MCFTEGGRGREAGEGREERREKREREREREREELIGGVYEREKSCERKKQRHLAIHFPNPFSSFLQTHSGRVEAVGRFIQIATELLRNNNLFSMGAILSGFTQTPLHRLKRIWEGKDVRDF